MLSLRRHRRAFFARAAASLIVLVVMASAAPPVTLAGFCRTICAAGVADAPPTTADENAPAGSMIPPANRAGVMSCCAKVPAARAAKTEVAAVASAATPVDHLGAHADRGCPFGLFCRLGPNERPAPLVPPPTTERAAFAGWMLHWVTAVLPSSAMAEPTNAADCRRRGEIGAVSAAGRSALLLHCVLIV
jgi:hypothetical protein